MDCPASLRTAALSPSWGFMKDSLWWAEGEGDSGWLSVWSDVETPGVLAVSTIRKQRLLGGNQL